jgi:Leucine-rich repeat (LRR) protein
MDQVPNYGSRMYSGPTHAELHYHHEEAIPHWGWTREASIWRYDPQGVDVPPDSLELSNTATDSDLAALVHVKWIRSVTSLDLSQTKVTGAGLENLKELKNLKTLDLSGTSVTDAGLDNLKELKGLKDLNLSNTKVTDAGLDSLKELKGLTFLYLKGTKVTDVGLASLRAALPNTDISR